MHWEVQLVGDPTDLRMLADTFSDSEIRIAVTGEEYVLRAHEFQDLDSASSVRKRAQEIVTQLSGSSRLLLRSYEPLEVGGVYRVKDDGRRDFTVFVNAVVVRVRALPVTVGVTKPNGTTEFPKPADPIAKWLHLATKDPAVAKALRLRDHDGLDLVELYRIFEVIEADVGSSTIHQQGWATKKSVREFKHTANSVDAAGDQARHGKEKTQPPSNPLSLPRARELIDRILKGWLEHKDSEASRG